MNDFDLRKLETPFPEEDLDWRIAQCGTTQAGKVWAKCLVYINARAVMDRLDQVVGPENWKDRYWKEGDAIMCGLSIKVNGEWIEKVDGSEATDIEAVKGGLSGALKRAAVKWMIGRYLYRLTEGWVEEINDKGGDDYHYAKTKEGKAFYWKPPHMPKWALPEGYISKSRASTIAQEKTEAATDQLKASLVPAGRVLSGESLAKGPERSSPPVIVAAPKAQEAVMPEELSRFLAETKKSFQDASTMLGLQSAVNLYNAKVKLGQDGQSGGVHIPLVFKAQVKAEIDAAKEERKKELQPPEL